MAGQFTKQKTLYKEMTGYLFNVGPFAVFLSLGSLIASKH